MLTRTLSICIEPGCSTPVPKGRCPAHAKKPFANRRVMRDAYSAEYRRNRLVVLARDPVCTICGMAPSTQADHIRPAVDGHRDSSIENLRGACGPCNVRRGAALGGSRQSGPAFPHRMS